MSTVESNIQKLPHTKFLLQHVQISLYSCASSKALKTLSGGPVEIIPMDVVHKAISVAQMLAKVTGMRNTPLLPLDLKATNFIITKVTYYYIIYIYIGG